MQKEQLVISDPNLRMHPNDTNCSEYSNSIRVIRIDPSGHSDRAGFSLVEALLSVSLFALLVTALVGAVIYGRESMAVSGARARAIAIAEEGLEATRNIRDASFAALTDGNHGLAISADQWSFSSTSDAVDSFTRQITISTPSTNRRQTISTITWQQTPSRIGSVALTTYHTNWRASSGGASTCLAFCISIGYTDATCRPAATTCEAHSEVHEPVGDPICVATSPGTALCCCN